MTETLHTLTAPARHEQEIRKSRFLAQAARVDTPEDALAWLQAVSDPAATHNCWAYRIGQAYRFNDDGEPGGTAGRPILQAIEGAGIDRVAVVVTRWYGGIKLGAGGLVRAYGGTAAECLRQAACEPWVPMARLAAHCPFAELALVKSRLKDLDAQIEEEHFDAEGAALVLACPAPARDALATLLVDLTRGRAEPRPLDPPAA